MLEHMHAMDQRLEQMCRGLKDLGAEIADLNLPDLGACEIAGAGESPAAEGNNAESEENRQDNS